MARGNTLDVVAELKEKLSAFTIVLSVSSVTYVEPDLLHFFLITHLT
jgi:hypothetical protein